MKFAVLLLLIFSSLCDLEVQNQPQSLIQESQKNDILIPTAGKQSIKVDFSNNVKSLKVDGHTINLVNSQKHHRKLNLIRRRAPVYRRTSRRIRDKNLLETEVDPSKGPAKLVTSNYPNEGNPSSEGTQNLGESTDETEKSQDFNDNEIEPEEGLNEGGEEGEQEEQGEGGEEGEEDRQYEGQQQEDDEYGEEEPADENSCPIISQKDMEMALEEAFDSDPTILNDEITEIDNFNDSLQMLISEENYTLTVSEIRIIINYLKSLKKFKESLCSESTSDNQANEEFYSDNTSDLGEKEDGKAENEVDNLDSDNNSDDTKEIDEQRAKRVRHIKIRNLNAIHRANRMMREKIHKLVKSFRANGHRNHLIRGNRRGVVVRRYLRSSPTRHVVFRPHGMIRSNVTGNRIVRSIRRAKKQTYRRPNLLRRASLKRFQRYV